MSIMCALYTVTNGFENMRAAVGRGVDRASLVNEGEVGVPSGGNSVFVDGTCVTVMATRVREALRSRGCEDKAVNASRSGTTRMANSVAGAFQDLGERLSRGARATHNAYVV